VDAVGQRRRHRLLQQVHGGDARRHRRAVRGALLALRKVGGHGDDRAGDCLPQAALCQLLEVLQHHCGQLLGAQLVVHGGAARGTGAVRGVAPVVTSAASSAATESDCAIVDSAWQLQRLG
jgi:hypothetical protein